LGRTAESVVVAVVVFVVAEAKGGCFTSSSGGAFKLEELGSFIQSEVGTLSLFLFVVVCETERVAESVGFEVVSDSIFVFVSADKNRSVSLV
jgi:hypothetical protein